MKKIIVSSLILTFCISSVKSQNLDFLILKDINHSYTSNGGGIQSAFSNSVTPIMIGIPVGLLAYSIFKKDSILRQKFYTVASSELVAGVLSTAMKFAFKRVRPFNTYPNEIYKHSNAGSYSFPSGHTSAAFSLATSISLEFPKWYVVAPSMLWASTVGYSRMYLGVHYPSDVLVGALVGAGTSYLCYKANQRIRKKHNNR